MDCIRRALGAKLHYSQMQLLFALTKGEHLWRFLLLPSHTELLVVAVGRTVFKPCPPRGSEQRRHNAQWVRINIAAGIKLCLLHCFCCGPCYFFPLKQYIILKNAVRRGGRVTGEGISERKKQSTCFFFFLLSVEPCTDKTSTLLTQGGKNNRACLASLREAALYPCSRCELTGHFKGEFTPALFDQTVVRLFAKGGLFGEWEQTIEHWRRPNEWSNSGHPKNFNWTEKQFGTFEEHYKK